MRLELMVTAVVLFSGLVLAQAAYPGSVLPSILFSETDVGSTPEWMKGYGVLISSAAGPLFTVWWAWYMTTKRLPEIEKSHDDRVDSLIEKFRSDIRSFWTEKREDDRQLANAINEFREAVLKATYKHSGPRPG